MSHPGRSENGRNVTGAGLRGQGMRREGEEGKDGGTHWPRAKHFKKMKQRAVLSSFPSCFPPSLAIVPFS